MKLSNPNLFKEQAYINGTWCGAAETIDVHNPATQEKIGTVPVVDEEHTIKAIEAAERARHGWAKLPAKHRSKMLRRWYDLILKNKKDLALIMTLEQGKPLAESESEIVNGAGFIDWFAEEAKRVYGDIIPGFEEAKRLLVIKQPIGVVAAITPWNFPNAMITRKCAPALAVGCSIVVKPAKETPFSALALAVLAEDAGIPPGVFNVVTGNPKVIGGIFSSHPLVRKLTFTGSTPIGKLLMKQCADTVKKVSLELGGNAPFIVFDDADLDAAVAGALISKYRNSGQTCVCANRLLVQDSIYDAFIEKFKIEVEKLVVGNGVDTGVTQGPLINRKAVDKVEEHIKDAVDNGASIVTGGTLLEAGKMFFKPTVLRDVSPTMKINHDETFGPVAAVVKFSTEEEAVKLANNTPFGLAAYFYSKNISRVWRVAEAIETGMIGVNTGLISSESAPFGGIKESGLGREGSKYGLDDFIEMKYICLDIK